MAASTTQENDEQTLCVHSAAPIQTLVPILVEHVVRNRIFVTRESKIFPIIDMDVLEQSDQPKCGAPPRANLRPSVDLPGPNVLRRRAKRRRVAAQSSRRSQVPIGGDSGHAQRFCGRTCRAT